MADYPDFPMAPSEESPANPVDPENTSTSTENIPAVTPPEAVPAPRYYPANQAPQYTQYYTPPAPTPSYPAAPYRPYGQQYYQSPTPQPMMQQPFQQPYTPPYPPASPAYPSYNYYQQQQPGYIPPVYPPAVAPTQPGEGLSIASLILSLVALSLVWIPFLNLILSAVALILGIVAKSKGSGSIAIAGIVISAVAAAISCIVVIFMIITIASSSTYYPENYYDEWPAAFTSLINKLCLR